MKKPDWELISELAKMFLTLAFCLAIVGWLIWMAG